MSDNTKNDDPYEDLGEDFAQDDMDFEESGQNPDSDEYYPGEDEFSENEEWNGEPEGNQQQAGAQKKKGGGLSFNTMVTIGAVVVGLIVFVMQLGTAPSGGSGPQGGQPQQIASIPMHSVTGTQNAPGQSDTQSALPPAGTLPPGLMTDPASPAGEPPAETTAALPDVPRGPSDGLPPPPAPEVVQPEDVPMPAPIAPAVTEPPPVQVQASPDVLTPMPAPPIPAATPEDAVQGEELPPPAPVQLDLAPETVTATGTASPLSAAALTGLEEKLEDLGARLDEIETRMSEVSASTVSAADVQALKDALARLEDKIEDLPATTTRQNETPSPEREPVAAPRDVQQDPPEQSAPSVKIKAEPRKASKAAPQWELRSAQPGTAWVGRKGEGEMQSVGVGDSLPGLGRITSISFMDGLWVIEGTQGRLTQ